MSRRNIKNTIDDIYCPWDMDRFSSELNKFYKKGNSEIRQEGIILVYTKNHYLTPSFDEKYIMSFSLRLDTSTNTMNISVKPESSQLNSFLLHKGFMEAGGYFTIKDIILSDYNRPVYWYSERNLRSFLKELSE
ncbi:hypothetical protein OXIME_000808 [Oxyplasma meridianum]|uniref:Uncharacterized protein n=1 Tax=Oxyplasma meridianum TaxID=3073602 RepID=A0AAX4NGC4_9ARCH